MRDRRASEPCASPWTTNTVRGGFAAWVESLWRRLGGPALYAGLSVSNDAESLFQLLERLAPRYDSIVEDIYRAGSGLQSWLRPIEQIAPDEWRRVIREDEPPRPSVRAPRPPPQGAGRASRPVERSRPGAASPR